MNASTDEVLEDAVEPVVMVFSDDAHELSAGGILQPSGQLIALNLTADELRFDVQIESPGAYALFAEHHPDEFQTQLFGSGTLVKPVVEREFKPDHEHDDEVTSVGITTPGNLDADRLNDWISDLLRTKGTDIFRMKGILSINGQSTDSSSKVFICSSTVGPTARGVVSRVTIASSSSGAISTGPN